MIDSGLDTCRWLPKPPHRASYAIIQPSRKNDLTYKELVPGATSTGVKKMDFVPTGSLLCASFSGTPAAWWDPLDGMEAEHFQFVQTSSMEYEMLSYVQTVASISQDGAAIHLRNIVTGTARRIASAHERGIFSMAFSTDDSQTLASGAFDGMVKLWDIKTGVETATLKRRILSSNPLEHALSPAPLLYCKFRDTARKGFETRHLGSPDEIWELHTSARGQD